MNIYFQEVIAAHVAIERWLSEGAGDEQALLARFSADYAMITLAGSVLDTQGLHDFFHAQRGARPGLVIELDEMTLVAEWPAGAVVRYRERQMLPEEETTLRWSTAVFELQDGRPQWRHLHETRLPG